MHLKLIAVVGLLSLLPTLHEQDNVSSLKYNNGQIVDLGAGLWGNPIPYDYDCDGLYDIFMTCVDTPYRGTYYFHNIGTLKRPFFDVPVKVSDEGSNMLRTCEAGGKRHILTPEKEYPDFFKSYFAEPKEIPFDENEILANYKNHRSNAWSYADWDGDGDLDLVIGIGIWDDYGWDNAYDSLGNWKNGPLHGYVYLIEDDGGRFVNRGRVLAGGKPIDVYGAPNPCVADFDGDGDLDVICGDFVDSFTWFNNVGSREKPVFAEGRVLQNRQGEIKAHLEMTIPTAVDLDKDGFMDIIFGDEDGRVAWIRNSGKVRKGMPQFGSSVYLRQKADLMKFGALSTPCAYDWNGDGLDDIIAGCSSGEIAFFMNMSGGDVPFWNTPMLIESDGKIFRVTAGQNGSIQGPAERKWGYTVLSVGDLDGDGLPDIIFNSILGKVQWLRNLGKGDGKSMSKPLPVYVEGETKKPAWNWWDPELGTLVTQWRTTPVLEDWNKDGLLDLISMDQEGYLSYYERIPSSDGQVRFKEGRRIFYGLGQSLYKNGKIVHDSGSGPIRLNDGKAGNSGRRKICFVDWDGDGRKDLIVDSRNACWFRNVKDEDGKTWLEYKGNVAERRLAGHSTCPTPVDWNRDGIYDLILGAEDGHFYYIKNPLGSK